MPQQRLGWKGVLVINLVLAATHYCSDLMRAREKARWTEFERLNESKIESMTLSATSIGGQKLATDVSLSRVEIQELLPLMQAAKEEAPAHPNLKYKCDLRVNLRSPPRSIQFELMPTTNQGLLINGMQMHRNDKIEPFIERILKLPPL